MDSEKKKELIELIKKELSELEGQILQFRESSKPIAPDCAIGRITRMEAIQSKAMSEASLESAQQKKMQLEDALKRIDQDEHFGTCSRCGEEIPFKRLLFMPSARRCVNCS